MLDKLVSAIKLDSPTFASAVLSGAGFLSSASPTESLPPLREALPPLNESDQHALESEFVGLGLLPRRERSFCTNTYQATEVIDLEFGSTLMMLNSIQKDEKIRREIIKLIVEDCDTRLVSVDGERVTVDRDVDLMRRRVTVRLNFRMHIEPQEALERSSQLKQSLAKLKTFNLTAYLGLMVEASSLSERLMKDGVSVKTVLEQPVWINDHFMLTSRTSEITFKPAKGPEGVNPEKTVITCTGVSSGTLRGPIGLMMLRRASSQSDSETSAFVRKIVDIWGEKLMSKR